ncbi:hypothetical protein EHE19_013265 [Ruminiclostridium herbifermentans]|uniref:Glycosyltransferase RgtA/B/C/D-like domain-containing protein n=2 Tax=Ruminiclostridium herbifermentans TaxID=2488810 RepID=A0A4V6ENL0_9FIRM|nr:hypothetical protein EHE19_013265 [Ruminiclostridium herbifermentans]
MANYFRTVDNTKFGAILNKIIISILAVFSLYLIYLNFYYYLIDGNKRYTICTLLALSVFVLIHFLSCYIKISHRAFAIVIFLMVILSKGILIFFTDTKPVSDFAVFYQYAAKLLNGEKSFQDILYFKTWAYQTGPVIYYAALMKLFGTGLFPLKMANCFFMAGTNALIYLIAHKISNDFTARVVSILYLLYPAPYFLTTVLTNQHFAACMFLLSIYILLLKGQNWGVKSIAAGAVIALGNAVRPIGIIILAALILCGIIEKIANGKWLMLGSTILVLISCLLVSYGCSALVKYTGINSEGLANNFPLWKFVVGLNYETKGQFSFDDENNIFNIQDFNERDNAAKQVIKQRMSAGIRKLAVLINEKQKIMWAGTDSLSWGFYQKIDGQLVPSNQVKKIEPFVLKYEKIYYIFIFLLMFIGLFRILVNNKINQGILLLSLILLCYFGIHFFIEIQVRYRYFAVIIVFIMAAKGSEMLLCRCRGYRKNIKYIKEDNCE